MTLRATLLVLALLPACSGTSKATLPAPVAYTAVAGVPNASSMGTLILAGQPTTEQVTALGAAGIETILDLRGPDERPGRDEAAEAAAAGIDYKSLPLSGADGLSDEYIDRMRAELRTLEGKPAMLHCGSANRVGAVMIPYLVLDQGRSIAQAVREAEQIGLRSAALKEKAVAYTQARDTAE